MEHCFFNRYDFTICSRARFHNLILCVYGSISVIFRSYPNLIGCLIIAVSVCLLCRDFLIQKIGILLSKILFCIRDRIKGNLAIQVIGLSLADGCFAFLHFFALQDKGKLSICKQTASQILLSGKIQSSLCMVCIGKLRCSRNFRLHRTTCGAADLIDLCCCRKVSIPVIGNGYFYMVNRLIVSIAFCLFCRDFLIQKVGIGLSCILFRIIHLREGNASVCVIRNGLFVLRRRTSTLQCKGEPLLKLSQCLSGQNFISFHLSITGCLINIGKLQFLLFIIHFPCFHMQSTVAVVAYFCHYGIDGTVILVTLFTCCRSNLLYRVGMGSDISGRILDRLKVDASVCFIRSASKYFVAFSYFKFKLSSFQCSSCQDFGSFQSQAAGGFVLIYKLHVIQRNFLALQVGHFRIYLQVSISHIRNMNLDRIHFVRILETTEFSILLRHCISKVFINVVFCIGNLIKGYCSFCIIPFDLFFNAITKQDKGELICCKFYRI